MNIKKILFPALLVGAGMAVIRSLYAKTFSAKPVYRGASYDAIDAYVQQQMQRLHIPGVSLAIVEGDGIVHLRGFGKARPGSDAPTPQTPFFIGSLTKSITALAVMQLAEAGKVELDDPVQRYLPWFRVADPVASARMTVRHLLNQTSGFSSSSGEVIMADFDDRPGATERQVRALSTLKLIHPVGEKVEYSNLNYNILGLIVEVTSGELYTDYIHSHIFTPLHMSHSYTSKAAAQQDDLAIGHRHWFGFPIPAPNLPIPISSLPSGQLISCAEDMAHYLIAHLNGGRYAGEQILSNAGINELHHGVKEYIALGISSGFYAMGWFDQHIGQTRVLSHSGNVPDFSAFMVLIPEQQKGLVMLLNADPYGLPPITEEIGMNATALLAGQQPAPIKLDFIQWIFRLLPLIPLLQVMSVFTTLRRLRQWDRDPRFRPGSGRMWGQHILLPLIPSLSLAALLVYLRSKNLLRFMHLFMPDLAWIVSFSGAYAALWAFLRNGLMLQTVRKPRP